MARRQQSTNKTRANKSGSKAIVRRHSKRLQRQQRDLPSQLQDLSCITRDQASGEEDTSSILTQSGSEISLQDISSRVEYLQSESSCSSEDMLSVLQPQVLPMTGCHGPVGGCQASMPLMPWGLSEGTISNETIIAFTDFTTTSEIAKRRIQSKRIKRQQRQIRSGSVVSSVSSSRSSVASPDINSVGTGFGGEAMSCGDIASVMSCCTATTSVASSSAAGNSTVMPSAITQQVTMATSHPLEVPIPTYIPSQQQSVIPTGYSQGQHLTNPMLSHLQQELSYRFVKDQSMAAATATTTASCTVNSSSKIPTGELGSSVSSAFQKKVATKWCNAHVTIARFIQSHRNQQQQAAAAAAAATQENHKVTEVAQCCSNTSNSHIAPSTGVMCYQHPLTTSSTVTGAAGLLWQQQQQQQSLQLWQQQQSQQPPPQLVPISTSQYQFLQTVPMHVEAPAHSNNNSAVSRSLSVPMGSLLLPQGILQVPSVLPSTAVLQTQGSTSLLPTAAAHPYQMLGAVSQQLPQLQQLSSGGTSAAMGAFLVNNNHSLIAPLQPAFISSWVK